MYERIPATREMMDEFVATCDTDYLVDSLPHFADTLAPHEIDSICDELVRRGVSVPIFPRPKS